MTDKFANQPPSGIDSDATNVTSRLISIHRDVAPRSLVGRQLAIRIKLQRSIAKLSLEVLAETTDLSVVDLDEIERGQTSLPAALLPQIALALGKSVEWFYAPLVRRIPDAKNSDLANCVSDTVPAALLAAYAEQLTCIQATNRGIQNELAITADAGLVGGRGRVLLVDDSPDVLVGIGAFLESADLEVIRVTTAEEALRIAMTAERIDLVITDYALPGSSGYDLLTQLAELRSTLPGIIITGYAEAISLEGLPAHTRFLRKPFRRKALVDNVKELLRRRVVADAQS
jgi:CheY-like chemotaxis protein/transcriptional regulator with XRE-family HTH domain